MPLSTVKLFSTWSDETHINYEYTTIHLPPTVKCANYVGSHLEKVIQVTPPRDIIEKRRMSSQRNKTQWHVWPQRERP